jgi:hypothetical protein
MSLLLKVLQLSLCSLVARLARPILMILLGRVVVVALGRVVRVVRIMVLGRVVRVVRIMVLGWVVRVVRIMVLGRVVRIMVLGWVVWVVRIMVLGRVVRVTSGYDHGEDEEQGHQQRRHKAVLRHCRSLSPVISVLGGRLVLSCSVVC